MLQAEEETKDKQRQYELEKAKLSFKQKLERFKHFSEQRREEKREKHRSELEKYERQMQACERGYVFHPSQVQFGVSHREAEEEAADPMQMQEKSAQIADMSRVSIDNPGPPSLGRGSGKAPKMPYFDEERDFMDSYLGRFERFATCRRWKRADWALYLSALLKGRALDVYSMLPADQANNYDQLKAALLKRYQLSADKFKRRFRTVKPVSGETPTQFLTRIGNYLQRWIELANAEKSFDELKTLIMQGQYLSVCRKEMAMHFKEGKLKSIQKLGEKAENYVEAHATDIFFGIDPKPFSIRRLRPKTRQCHNCGEVGHIRSQCLEPSSPRNVGETFRTSASPQTSSRQRRQVPQQWLGFDRQSWSPRQQGQSQQRLSPRQYGQASQHPRSPRQYRQPRQLPKFGLGCFLCDQRGHLARECLVRPKTAAMVRENEERIRCMAEKEEQLRSIQEETDELAAQLDTDVDETSEFLEAEKTKVKVAAGQPAKTQSTARTRSTPVHRCQAKIAVCQDCGQHHPVDADACLIKDHGRPMPVVDGIVENQPASVLRDTKCSTVVVRRSLIPDEKLTCLEERCILIDGTIRRTPVAKIEVETSYFLEKVTAVCMEHPIYDLIIGNVSGAADPQPSSRLSSSGQPTVSDSFAPDVTCWVMLLLLPILLLLQLLDSHNKRQPDLNLREPSSESAEESPKLKLLPRTVKDPVNTVIHTKRNASIFGNGKPRESSLVKKAKQTLTQSSRSHGQSTDWRKHRRLVIGDPRFQTGPQTHTRAT